MNTDYLIFLCLYLSSLIVRTGYELLKKVGRVNPKSRIVFASDLFSDVPHVGQLVQPSLL